MGTDVPTGVLATRLALGLTQGELAMLVGVHALTVSKWERGVLSPSPYQSALLDAFGRAARVSSSVGLEAVHVLCQEGTARALLVLLSRAFGDE